MPSFPHVKSLKLRNFKGVAELDLEFDESLTLLAGVNGVGKTSVLQALLAAVTTAWSVGTDLSYPIFRFPGECPARRGERGACRPRTSIT